MTLRRYGKRDIASCIQLNSAKSVGSWRTARNARRSKADVLSSIALIVKTFLKEETTNGSQQSVWATNVKTAARKKKVLTRKITAPPIGSVTASLACKSAQIAVRNWCAKPINTKRTRSRRLQHRFHYIEEHRKPPKLRTSINAFCVIIQILRVVINARGVIRSRRID